MKVGNGNGIKTKSLSAKWHVEKFPVNGGSHFELVIDSSPVIKIHNAEPCLHVCSPDLYRTSVLSKHLSSVQFRKNMSIHDLKRYSVIHNVNVFAESHFLLGCGDVSVTMLRKC